MSEALILLRELPPYIIVLGIAFITFGAIRLLVWSHKKKLKIQLGIEQQRWNKLREERIKIRQRYSDRLEIPNILLHIYERTKTLADGKEKISLSEETAENFGNTLNKAGMLPKKQPKIGSYKELMKSLSSLPNPFTNKASPMGNIKMFLLNLQSSMAMDNLGIMPLTEADTEYKKLLIKIRNLQIGLPHNINVKIDDYIITIKALVNITLFDFESIKSEMPGFIRIYFPYFPNSMESLEKNLLDNITKDIEQFLLGEDL